MDVLKFGIVGYGKMGLLHSAIVNALPNCRVVAIAEKAAFMASALSSTLSDIRVYKDYLSMLDEEDLDAVIITTPTNSHCEIGLECLRRSIHFFIEKPLSTTSEESRPLAENIDMFPEVRTMVGYMYHYVPSFAKAKEILDSGCLGKLQFFNAKMYVSQLFHRGKGWRYSKQASGGGVLITQNSHLVDLLIWLFGDIKAGSAHTMSLYSEEVEDMAHAVLEFKSGVRGWFDASWSIRHHRTLTIELEVQGENGNLAVNDDETRLYLDEARQPYPDGWKTWRKPELYEGVAFDVGGTQFSAQMEAFVNGIRSGSDPSSNVVTAHRTQMTLDTLYRSAANNGIMLEI